MPKTLGIPDFPWLDRLRQNHEIHLVKEEERARVEFAYEPPNPGCFCGRIGIVRHSAAGLYQQTWYIDTHGRGIDGSQIIAPVEDNLPDEAAPIADVWQRYVERKLDRLYTRIDQLESIVDTMESSFP